ncbi:CCA tRNA nucleotidyltransferase, mitochondrial [Mortierella sp. AD094]|nr:CCA tRNA nucleotidyltransferase, mitochondrial [Mortierella sp. AD094]
MSSMGILIKQIGSALPTGKDWPSAFLYGLGVELLPNYEQLKQGVLDEDAKTKIAKYNTFLSKAEAYGIEHCYAWESIINTSELIRLLNTRDRATIQKYTAKIMEWQFQNPRGTKEDCEKWILEELSFK